MQFTVSPFGGSELSLGTWIDGWTGEELDRLEAFASCAGECATIGSATGYQEARKIRRSNVRWLNCDGDHVWIFQRLAHQALSLNRQHWNLDVTGFGEPLQMTR